MSDFTPSAHESLSLQELLKTAASDVNAEDLWQYVSTSPNVLREISRSANWYREYIAVGFSHEDIMLATKIGYPIDKAAQKTRRYFTTLEEINATIRPIDQHTPIWDWIDGQMMQYHADSLPLTRDEFVRIWCELADLHVGDLIGLYIQVRKKSNNISHDELLDLIRRLSSRGGRSNCYGIRNVYAPLRRKGWSPKEAEAMLGYNWRDVKYIIEARRRGMRHEDLVTISEHGYISLAKIACALRDPYVRPSEVMQIVQYESQLMQGEQRKWGAALLINPVHTYLKARKEGLNHRAAYNQLTAEVTRHIKR